MVIGLNEVLPETSILPTVYLSVLFCDIVRLVFKNNRISKVDLATKKIFLFRTFILFNLFTSFSKSSFSVLITNYSLV